MEAFVFFGFMVGFGFLGGILGFSFGLTKGADIAEANEYHRGWCDGFDVGRGPVKSEG